MSQATSPGPKSAPQPPIAVMRSQFAANSIAAIGYGMYVILAILVLREQLRKLRSRKQRLHYVMLIYSIVTLCLATIWYTTGIAWSGFTEVEVSAQPELARTVPICPPLNFSRTLSHALMIWLADGMMIWRAYIIWNKNKVVIVPLVIFYIASIGLGIALEVSCFSPNPTMFGPVSVPFYGVSVVIVLLAHFVIAFKLLYHRRKLQQAGMNRGNALRTYTSVASIIVESGLLYTISGVVYFALMLENSPAQLPIGAVFGCASFIAPALIQWRVSKGIAYSEESKIDTRATHSIEFTTGPTGPSRDPGTRLSNSAPLQEKAFESLSPV